MNCSWAALAGEAVFSYRGEIAGHAHLVMPLHGESDHLDLRAGPGHQCRTYGVGSAVSWVLWSRHQHVLGAVLVLLVGLVLHVPPVGALVHGGRPVVGQLLLAVRKNPRRRIRSVHWRYLPLLHCHRG
jgi:hypothetical protein